MTMAEACRQLLARRSEICQAEQIGLTKLYNAMDEGAWADLKTLHQALDESVAACYGWSRSVAQDDAEIVRRLTALNKEITEGRAGVRPVQRRWRPDLSCNTAVSSRRVAQVTGERAARYGIRAATSPAAMEGAARGLSVDAFMGQAVRFRRGFSPRDARSKARRSLSSASSSGMDRRSSSMSQWVRTALTFLYSGSG